MRRLSFQLVGIILVVLIICSDSFAQNKNESRRLDSIKRLNSLAKKYISDSTDYSIQIAETALALSKKTNDVHSVVTSLFNLGTAYLINDRYDKAFENGVNALDLSETSSNVEDKANALTLLGWLYYDIGDGETSLQYHSQANEIIKKGNDQLKLATSINAVGLTYAMKGEFQKSIGFFWQSFNIGQQIADNERMTASLNNIGDAEIQLGHFQSADSILNAAFVYCKSLSDVLREAELRNSLANLYMHQGKTKQALFNLSLAKQLISRSTSTSAKEFLLRNAMLTSQLYDQTRDYLLALKNLRLYDSLYQQILSDAKKNSVAQMKIEMNAKKNQAQIEKLEEEKILRVKQRNAIALAIIFLSVVGFIAYSRERQLRIKEKELAEAKEKLMQADIEKTDLENQMLANKLEFKNSEITNFALHLSQRNELLNIFLEELDLIKKKVNPETAQQLEKSIKKFSNKEQITQETEQFHVNVETEYKDFLFNLSVKFPDLTENEKRLCTQVRLNLSIKDIASINGISVKSVEMARYRLRKKFDLDHEANLTEFLKQF